VLLVTWHPEREQEEAPAWRGIAAAA